jgi:hypothetical protein
VKKQYQEMKTTNCNVSPPSLILEKESFLQVQVNNNLNLLSSSSSSSSSSSMFSSSFSIFPPLTSATSSSF